MYRKHTIQRLYQWASGARHYAGTLMAAVSAI